MSDGPAVVFHNVEFSGFEGPKVPADCPDCGTVMVSLPVDFEAAADVFISQSKSKCPNCGQTAIPYDGFYRFVRFAIQTFVDARPKRQQLRRLALKAAKSTDIEELQKASAYIHPAFPEIIQEAKKQQEPWISLKRVIAIGLAICSFGGGVITADEIWDRWKTGQLFESHSSHESKNIEDDSESESEREEAGKETKKPQRFRAETEAE